MAIHALAPKNKKAPVGRARDVLAGLVIQLCVGIIYLWSVFKAPVAAITSGGALPRQTWSPPS